jgi:hypothetical protein
MRVYAAHIHTDIVDKIYKSTGEGLLGNTVSCYMAKVHCKECFENNKYQVTGVRRAKQKEIEEFL